MIPDLFFFCRFLVTGTLIRIHLLLYFVWFLLLPQYETVATKTVSYNSLNISHLTFYRGMLTSWVMLIPNCCFWPYLKSKGRRALDSELHFSSPANWPWALIHFSASTLQLRIRSKSKSLLLSQMPFPSISVIVQRLQTPAGVCQVFLIGSSKAAHYRQMDFCSVLLVLWLHSVP